MYTQLAIDARQTTLLSDVAEDCFGDVLRAYYKTHALVEIDDRLSIACQYYSAVGLGKMVVRHLGPDTGEVEVERSHIDEGWLKKWGKYDRPVNYITAGFVSGLIAATFDLPPRSFEVTEVDSMAMGAQTGRFQIVRR